MRWWGFILVCWLVLTAPALADTCLSGHTPCTLPCTATGTASNILASRSTRTELLVCNQDTTNVLFVILGQGTTLSGTSMTTNYGIPVSPSLCMDFGVGPNPQAQIHTVSSDVWIITAGSTIACSYLEKAD